MLRSNGTFVIKDVFHMPTWARVLYYLGYSTVIVIGLLGNSSIIASVIKNVKLRTSTNILVCNLCIVNIIMCIPTFVFVHTFVTLKGGYLEVETFIGLETVLFIAGTVSTWTSAAISALRCRGFVSLWKFKTSKWITAAVLAVIWIIAISIGCAPIFSGIVKMRFSYMHITTNKTSSSANKSGPAGDHLGYRIFLIAMLVTQIFLPAAIMCLSYSKVSWTLRNHLNVVKGSKTREMEVKDFKQYRKMNLMLVSIVALFILCYLPMVLFWVIREFASLNLTREMNSKLDFGLPHLILLSVAYNPILYGFMNTSLRKEIKLLKRQIVHVVCKKKSSVPPEVTNQLSVIDENSTRVRNYVYALNARQTPGTAIETSHL